MDVSDRNEQSTVYKKKTFFIGLYHYFLQSCIKPWQWIFLVDAGQESEGFIDQTIVKKYYHYYFNILNILYSAFSFFSDIDEWTKNTAGKWRKGMKTQSY